jgi:hypothetical protein
MTDFKERLLSKSTREISEKFYISLRTADIVKYTISRGYVDPHI